MEELLKKYIAFILSVEGTDFIDEWDRKCSDIEFTDEEWDTLARLSGDSYEDI